MKQDKITLTRQSLAFLLLATTLTACESTDLPIQHADNYGEMTFSAQAERLDTRTNPYEPYDTSKHPSTMGAYGYYDIASYAALNAANKAAQHALATNATRAVSTPNPIFDNETVTYSSTSWSYGTPNKWDDYKGATSFDFFAYMPQSNGAKLERTATNTYTLSLPFVMPTFGSDTETTQAPGLLHETEAPIICATPIHKENTDATGNQFTFERLINFRFDQTMTAYKLLFKLDSKMGAIRRFRITSVTFSGDIATSGTISRTYTWNKDGNKEWTASDIQWTDIKRTTYDDLPYGDKDEELTVTSDDYQQWGQPFYAIPDANFMPKITVTYDVEFVDENGTTVVTRKGVTSDILLNKTNFNNLATGGIAMVNAIRILIQPRYLYVLADGDAYSGHLLID